MTTIHAELSTIRDFIRFAASSFNAAGLYFGHGTDNAIDEAFALILHTLHLPYQNYQAVLDAKLTTQEKNQILHLITERIEKRIPVPYLTHEAWFAGFSFYVDERVLIPRSPLAELIEKQFAPWVNARQISHILDLCTGSACIAIACAKFLPEAIIHASDISTEALNVAKINVLRHHVEEQVELIHSDLFAEIPPNTLYDVIISNPPYVNQAEMAALPAEYLHEPALGFEAGKNGLDIVKRILKEAKNYLKPHGILVVEVGNSERTLAETFTELPFTWLEFERGEGGVFLLTQEQL